MSFNHQLLSTLGQLGINNSELASAVLLAATSQGSNNASVQPSQPRVAPVMVPNAAGHAPIPPSNTTEPPAAQLQALVPNISPPPAAQTTPSNQAPQLSKANINQVLTSLLIKKKLEDETKTNAAAGRVQGTCTLRPSTSMSAMQPGQTSPLQQVLGKVIQLNDSNLKQHQPELQQRRNSSASQQQGAVVTAMKSLQQQQQQQQASAASGTILQQLSQLQSPQISSPTGPTPTLQAGSTASSNINGDLQGVLANLVRIAELVRQQKEQEQRILEAARNIRAANPALALLLQQKVQQQPREQPSLSSGGANGNLAGLLAAIQNSQDSQRQALQQNTPSAPTLSTLLQTLQGQVPATSSSCMAASTQATSATHVPAPQVASSNAIAPAAAPVAIAPASSPNGIPAVVAVPEKKRRRGRSGSFPQKIHQMLRDLEQQGRQDIASFVREGTAFCIHRPKEFAKEVMPKYFKMGSYASFQRQLNLYDFTRIGEGPDRGSYFHKLFLQGKPLLSTTMKRKESKKAPPPQEALKEAPQVP